jgi:hypothetical protein
MNMNIEALYDLLPDKIYERLSGNMDTNLLLGNNVLPHVCRAMFNKILHIGTNKLRRFYDTENVKLPKEQVLHQRAFADINRQAPKAYGINIFYRIYFFIIINLLGVYAWVSNSCKAWDYMPDTNHVLLNY